MIYSLACFLNCVHPFFFIEINNIVANSCNKGKQNFLNDVTPQRGYFWGGCKKPSLGGIEKMYKMY